MSGPMRRAERQITDPRLIRGILEESPVLFLSFNDQAAPYVVPLFFGHEEGRLYVHGAREGTKMRLLAADPRVGFAAAAPARILAADKACSFTARTRSVAGTGRGRVVQDPGEKRHGLDLIMRHYAGSGSRFTYGPADLGRVAVIAIDIVTILGRGTENGSESPGTPGAGQQVR